MSELSWIAKARTYIGLKETKGPRHTQTILKFLDLCFKATGVKSFIKDDETPWCGTFVGGVLVECGLAKHLPKPHFYRALEWNKVGTKLARPAYGSVAVLSRKGGGHVGFVVGKDRFGNIMLLGGNQGDEVNIKPFHPSRIVGYRWCGTQPVPADHRYNLPVLHSNGKVSTNEA